MKKILLLLLALLLTGRAYALCDDWRWTDTALLVGALAYTEVDREQTTWFLTHTRDHETNPLLYGHPSVATVNTDVALAATTTTLAACLLPAPWRDALLVGWLLVEAGSVTHNAQMLHTSTITPSLGFSLSW